MPLTDDISNRLHDLRRHAEAIRTNAGALEDLDAAGFDYNDAMLLIWAIETDVLYLKKFAAAANRLTHELRRSEGEPVGRKRREEA